GQRRVTAEVRADALAWGSHALRDVSLTASPSPRTDARLGQSIAFRFRSGDIRSESNGVLATAPAATFDGSVWLDAALRPMLEGEFAFTDGEFSHEAARLHAGGISATLPVTWNVAALVPGTFNVAMIQVGDDFHPNLTG